MFKKDFEFFFLLGNMMEAKIFKKRIKKAFSDREFIKIVFQYPSRDRAIIKRGIVVSMGNDGFELQEIYDGLVAYAYEYIVEIKGEGNI